MIMIGKSPNIDHVLLSCSSIRKLLETALQAIMPDTKDLVIRDIEKSGIRLGDETAYCSLSEIRYYLHLVMGPNGAEILIDAMRNVLLSTNDFAPAAAKETGGNMTESLLLVREYRHRKIPQNMLMSALDEELSELGKSIQDVIYEQLSRKGIIRKDIKASYTMDQLHKALEESIGNEAASLLVERLYTRLFHGD